MKNAFRALFLSLCSLFPLIVHWNRNLRTRAHASTSRKRNEKNQREIAEKQNQPRKAEKKRKKRSARDLSCVRPPLNLCIFGGTKARSNCQMYGRVTLHHYFWRKLKNAIRFKLKLRPIIMNSGPGRACIQQHTKQNPTTTSSAVESFYIFFSTSFVRLKWHKFDGYCVSLKLLTSLSWPGDQMRTVCCEPAPCTSRRNGKKKTREERKLVDANPRWSNSWTVVLHIARDEPFRGDKMRVFNSIRLALLPEIWFAIHEHLERTGMEVLISAFGFGSSVGHYHLQLFGQFNEDWHNVVFGCAGIQ